MYVNDINIDLVARQNQVELQQRAAEERLAHEVLRERHLAHPGLSRRISRRLTGLFGRRPAVAAQHRTAH